MCFFLSPERQRCFFYVGDMKGAEPKGKPECPRLIPLGHSLLNAHDLSLLSTIQGCGQCHPHLPFKLCLPSTDYVQGTRR